MAKTTSNKTAKKPSQRRTDASGRAKSTTAGKRAQQQKTRKIESVDALELVRQNYKDYATYVSAGRSYPCLIDGLKSSYRRALFGMYENKSNKIVKVAELAAHALPYHPHPSSVAGVIVQLGEAGNRLKMIDTQGNWGDSSRGVEASAERYIGGRLAKIAEVLLLDAVEHATFVKGEIEKDEPRALPALVPYCFINGMTGIPTGLPALNIPPIKLSEMLDYYIDILSHKRLDYCPAQFPTPDLPCAIISPKEDWEAVMKTGKGSIRLAPTVTLKDNVITITKLPSGKTVEHVRKILEKEILLEKVDLRDESTDKVCIVVEKVPYKQCNMQELRRRLHAKLQTNLSCNFAFYDADKIFVPCAFDTVVKANLEYLIEVHTRKLAADLEAAKSRMTVLMIIEGLKKRNLVKSMFDLDHDESVAFLVKTFRCTENDAAKVLSKPISYLTREHSKEIEELEAEIRSLSDNKKNIYSYLLKKYKNAKKMLDIRG